MTPTRCAPGVYLQTDRLTSNTTSQVLPDRWTACRPPTCPSAIVDDAGNTQWIESALPAGRVAHRSAC